MMKWIFGDVGRTRYFGTFSAKDKCSGEKSTPHNLQLNGLSPGNQVEVIPESCAGNLQSHFVVK